MCFRHGIRHGAHNFELFYGTPSPGNEKAKERFDLNRFTVTRQLRYSQDDTQLALDIGLFINGLPVFTFELKNNLTKQTVSDAVKQYKNDRNPKEKLFRLGRCIAHFAVDEGEVQFCTHLDGKKLVVSSLQPWDGTMVRVTRPIRMGSRPTIYGEMCCPGRV